MAAILLAYSNVNMAGVIHEYEMNATFNEISIVGSFTTDGTVGQFNDRASFSNILDSFSITVSAAGFDVVYDIASFGNQAIGAMLSFDITESDLVITSLADSATAGRLFSVANEDDEERFVLDFVDNQLMFTNLDTSDDFTSVISELRFHKTAVPEPSTLWLFSSIILGFGFVNRKK